MHSSQFTLADAKMRFTDNYVRNTKDHDIKDPFDGFFMLFRGEEYRHRRSPEIPASWLSPHNFSDGHVYFRVEVFEKPNAVVTTGMLCRVTTECHHGTHNIHLGHRLCTFKTTGIHYFDQAVRWAYPMVPRTQFRWDLPIWEVQFVVTDHKGRTVHKQWEQAAACDPYTGSPELELYLPLEVRFSIVVVAQSERFVPPAGW